MIKLKSLTLFVSLLLISSLSFAQSNTQSIATTVEVTYAEHLGTIPPIRDLVPLSATTSEKRKQGKSWKKVPRNFIGRKKHEIKRPDLTHQGPDPVRQSSFDNSLIEVEPLVNIQGLFNGSAPHDPSGDVGKDYYVQAINATTIGVFDKEGNNISTFNANTLWSEIGFSSAGDPIVLYDQDAQRWLITEFPFGNQLLVAISQTSDPLGAWDAYNFATPNFPDYPKYGVWNNSYSVTTNEEGSGTFHAYFLNRESLLNGDPTVAIQRISLPGTTGSEQGFVVATPVDWSGLLPPSTDPMIVALNDSSWGDTPEDAIEVYSINLDWDDPNNTSVTNTTVVTSPYDANACAVDGPGFACVPQMGGGGLDGLPEFIQNQPHYRNFGSHESMVMCFMTDVDGNDLAGIRWTELRRLPGEDWSVYQEGTVGPDDGLHRFMASIAMDGSGNIGLGYNVSGPNSFAGVRYTGRRSSDPLGEMTVTEYNAAEGANSISSGGRFGDYAHMSIDPTNDRTFWFTTEYADNNQVRTRIVAFELRRDTIDIAPVSMVTPVSSPNLTDTETVVMEVKNFGLDTQNVFHVGYIFENGTPVVDSINFTLFPDSVYTHTFTPTVDMSALGDYNFKLFTSLDTDQAPLNDTIRTVVTKIPFLDAAIVSIEEMNGLNCGDVLPLGFTLTNFGADTLFSADIDVMLNGTLFGTINWEGALAMGESDASLTTTLIGLIDGTNDVTISVLNPNGAADEITDNDSTDTSFDVFTDGAEIQLLILTDDYPEETTWEVSDDSGTIIYSGGPYTEDASLQTEELCLDPEACYTFTIYDAYSDGICCGFGQGNYSIVDEDGNPLFSSTGEFGAEESNDFCATFTCMMTVEATSSPVSTDGASDGAILLTPANGIEPYMYSIDGGATFQESNMFTDLPAGDYDIVVQGDLDCLFNGVATVGTCAVGIMAEVVDATDVEPNSGQITISGANGNAPFQYSINGGVNFQSNNTFSGLGEGDYDLVVRDANGCEATLMVAIGLVLDIEPVSFGQIINLYPNPTDGAFRIGVEGLNRSSVFLPLSVYDANGKLMYEVSIPRYDQTYKGALSLYAYPDGVYFVKFHDANIKNLLRVVKQ